MKRQQTKMEFLNQTGNIPVKSPILERDDLKAVNAMVVAGMDRAVALDTMTKAKINQILDKYHHKAISETTDRGKTVWRTKVPNDNPEASNKYKKVQASTLDELKTKVAEYYLKTTEYEKTGEMTLKDLYTEWLADKSKRNKSKGTIDKHRTSWNRFYLDNKLAKGLICKPITDISGDELDLFVNQSIAEFEMTPHMWGDFSAILRQSLKYARRHHYIEVNPWDDVFVDFDNGLFDEETKTDEERIIGSTHIENFISYVWEQHRSGRHTIQCFIPLCIVFLFYTGLRIGEASALRFSDLDGNRLHIQRMTVAKEQTVKNKTKKKSKRTIKLMPEAVEVLDEVKRFRVENGLPLDGYIFAVDDKPWNVYKQAERVLPEYCREYGIFQHCPHSARRTYISMMLKGGLPIATIMKQAGHHDLKTFMDYYVYDTEDEETTLAMMSNAFKQYAVNPNIAN